MNNENKEYRVVQGNSRRDAKENREKSLYYQIKELESYNEQVIIDFIISKLITCFGK